MLPLNTVKPRNFESATRLEVHAGGIPPNDERGALVDEIKSLVKEVNYILMRRDGSFMTPENYRQELLDKLSEEYAEKMVLIEEKQKRLIQLEKNMKLPILQQ